MSEMNPSTAPALLRVDNLRVSFKGENKQYVETVKGISFEIHTVALVGESGSGKSVTSLAVMGLLAPENSKVAEDSQILFEGRDLLKLKSSEMREIWQRNCHDLPGTNVLIESCVYRRHADLGNSTSAFGHE